MPNPEAEIIHTLASEGITPEAVAKQFWEMDNEQQAQFFQHLTKLAGNQHTLMTQGIYIRQYAEKENPEALESYQSFFAAAYKYMGDSV